MLLLAGDLTDYGLAEETQVLVKEMTPQQIPTVAVLGNHDIEWREQHRDLPDSHGRGRDGAQRRRLRSARRRESPA